MVKTHIVLHHTVCNQSPISLVETGINAGHKQRNFPKSKLGWYVGYHYMIDLNGAVKQYRGDDEVGAHCSEQSMNFKGIGISLIGNFENDELTILQKQALINLLGTLTSKHNIPKINIGYHKMYKATACPGKNVIQNFKSIVDAVNVPVSDLDPWMVSILEKAKTTGVLTDIEGAKKIVIEAKEKPERFLALILELMRKSKNATDFN